MYPFSFHAWYYMKDCNFADLICIIGIKQAFIHNELFVLFLMQIYDEEVQPTLS